MKFSDAMKVINSVQQGFMVHFEWVKGGCLHSDYFPDKHAGEPLIASESEAWILAKKFADKTFGKCINFYVVGPDFVPVPDYDQRRIVNR